MPSGEHELRLLWSVLLNGLVLFSAYRCIGRFTSSGLVQHLADTLLLAYLIQYAAVAAPGVLGILSPWTMSAAAILISAGLYFFSRAPSGTAIATGAGLLPSFAHHSAVLAAGVFATAYLACDVYVLRYQPVIDTDALVYHFPVAVHWLRSGHLGLFPTWFFNPANTYSPLGGSMFIAWLLAPQGNDVIARFVQVGPLLMIYVAMVGLCAEVMRATALRVAPPAESASGSSASKSGARTCVTVAAWIGVAVMTFRPLLGEAVLGKDDLFMTAFFISAVAGSAPARLREPFAPWRIGIALGLCLATKYTALLTVPLFLLLADAFWRAGWRRRQMGIVLGLILLIAGPWFLRNVWLAGNPLYPLEVRVAGRTILRGLFQTRRSMDLRTAKGVWSVLAGRYHSVPVPILAVLAFGWLAAMVGTSRRIWREPLARLCMLGPPIGLVLFVFMSPYPEVRFVFPSLVLLFGASAIAIALWLRSAIAQFAAVAILAGVSVATGYEVHWAVAVFAAISLAAAAVAAGALFLQRRVLHWTPKVWTGLATTALVVAGAAAYIYWNAYVTDLESIPVDGADAGGDLIVDWWQKYYPIESPAWEYIRRHIPAAVTIAYANTSLVYPLMIPDRRVVYVPVRDGVRWPHDLPHFPTSVSGEQIIPTVTELTNAAPDDAGWLRRIKDSGAAYLVVAKNDAGPRPPEIGFADSDPAHFQRLFDDAHYRIYRIVFAG